MSDKSVNLDLQNRSWGVSRGVPRVAVRPVEVPFGARRPTRLGLLIMERAKFDASKGCDSVIDS